MITITTTNPKSDQPLKQERNKSPVKKTTKRAGKQYSELGTEPFTREQAIRLLNTADSMEERVLLLLGFNTGMSLAEIASLEPINFEFTNGLIKVWDRKKKHYRQVSVSDETTGEIRNLIDTHKDTAGPKLFLYSARTIEGKFQRHTLKVLGESRSWESVRWTYISISARLGIPIRIVVDNTGESPSAIVKYYIDCQLTNPRRIVNEIPLYPDSPKVKLKSDELKLILERPFVEKIDMIMSEKARLKYTVSDLNSRED